MTLRNALLVLVLGCCSVADASAQADIPECTRSAPGELLGPAPEGVRGAASIPWYEWFPMVMRADRPNAQPMQFRVKVDNGPATQVRLQLSGGGPLVTLLDNGVAPDVTAGDTIFSGNVNPDDIRARNAADRIWRPIIGTAAAFDGASAITGNLNVIGAVLPTGVSFPITNFSATQQATAYVYNVRDDAFGTDFNDQRVIQNLYTRFRDAYEFADVVYTPRNYVQNRNHGRIRNSVTGIGAAALDAGASYGSAAKLLGRSVFPNLSFYDPVNSGYSHELGHQWINSLGGVLADSRPGSHWPISPIANAVMGFSNASNAGSNLNCNLVRTSASSATATPATHSSNYNAFELYLMGLVPPASVPQSFVFNDQVAALTLLNNVNWCSGTISLANTLVDANTIITLHGARSPSSAVSDKFYNVATIAVSVGRLLSADELAFVSAFAQRAMLRGNQGWSEGLVQGTGPTFNAASGNRAWLDTRLDGFFYSDFE